MVAIISECVTIHHSFIVPSGYVLRRDYNQSFFLRIGIDFNKSAQKTVKLALLALITCIFLAFKSAHKANPDLREEKEMSSHIVIIYQG